MIDLKLDCHVIPDPDDGFNVVLLIRGLDDREKADVVCQWVRSSLMGNLELLGQMTGGTAHRAARGPNKSLS